MYRNERRQRRHVDIKVLKLYVCILCRGFVCENVWEVINLSHGQLDTLIKRVLPAYTKLKTIDGNCYYGSILMIAGVICSSCCCYYCCCYFRYCWCVLSFIIFGYVAPVSYSRDTQFASSRTIWHRQNPLWCVIFAITFFRGSLSLTKNSTDGYITCDEMWCNLKNPIENYYTPWVRHTWLWLRLPAFYPIEMINWWNEYTGHWFKRQPISHWQTSSTCTITRLTAKKSSAHCSDWVILSIRHAYIE